ncbi:colicin immunity protein Cui [Salmonella enterica]|nr:colicin immunity protein Cui [Salmonella enterica]EGJ9850502.1 colicin immunity protein Cui [Salmonella enterica]EHB3459939.1 colicin immunity protein Cui [Salmonella enterica]EHE9143030.1 colicin immunity protein Cui [Salmonella enterica]EHX5205218.1 colicin immunity protein Cui [Salmonella enterica]
MIDDNESNKAANNILYIFMCIGIFPLLIIFCIYLNDPDSSILYSIAAGTSNLPAITSAKNPLMTKVMDVYCKSAPLFTLLLIPSILHKRKIITPYNKVAIVRSCLMGPIAYVFYIYFFLFSDFEMSMGYGFSKLISGSDLTLLLFYVAVYVSVFFFTYFILLVPLFVCDLVKRGER